jgi:hypothetical protein
MSTLVSSKWIQLARASLLRMSMGLIRFGPPPYLAESSSRAEAPKTPHSSPDPVEQPVRKCQVRRQQQDANPFAFMPDPSLVLPIGYRRDAPPNQKNADQECVATPRSYPMA